MKMVIIAGGTGSIALQTGLHGLLTNYTDDLDIKVLVNAYDNGLSTGAVRKVMGGKILGPSDVRKNQTTRYSLLHPGRTPLLDFLDHRFTCETAKVRDYVFKVLDNSQIAQDKKNVLADGIETYFEQALSSSIDYNDFSIANIVYAGLAAMKGNSLREAARIMADVLEIEDNVILNDDTSLFLGAITKSGIRVTDEGDIVSWNNTEDPFADIFFTDASGEEKMPVLCEEAKRSLLEADVIILSSGTQWSSLIPTYASKWFRETMCQTRAKVLMVMNRVPDKDSPSQTADDIVNLLVPKYFPTNSIDLIVDNTSVAEMQLINPETIKNCLRSFNSFDLKNFNENESKKHHPMKLAHAITKTIYRDFIDGTSFMFDYDDTLVGRGNSFPKSSQFNRQALQALNEQNALVAVCTGNSIKAMNFDQRISTPDYQRPITIFADGGINKYEYNPHARRRDEEARPYEFIECLVPEAQLPTTGSFSVPTIITSLRLGGIPAAKIENRGNVMLTIKPIDPEYREIVRNLTLRILGDRGGLRVKATGRSTIEIASSLVEKSAAVRSMLQHIDVDEELVFLGDEFESGNDNSVLRLAETEKRIKCLRVKNPTDTAIFFIAISDVNYLY